MGRDSRSLMKNGLSHIALKALVIALAIVTALLGKAQADNVLRDGSKFLLESLGTIPGSRWLDGRTAAGTVGLAPRFGEPFSGTVWEPHGLGPRMFTLRNLGDVEGSRWLTCRTDTRAVTLSATVNLPPPATTAWRAED